MPERPDQTLVLDSGERHPGEQAEAAAAALHSLPRTDRYRISKVLASGGMGEVLIAHDVPLARDVVIKRMRTATPSSESVTRFLREARIQGRLEHPAIVPVYELAIDPDGRPFFAMKLIPGTTLADILARNKAGTITGWSRTQLLRAFVDICLAVELAHTRGVLHRDLKPGNIALGDFGEVYVLDWGVARIIGEDLPDVFDRSTPRLEVSADALGLQPEPGATMPGAILGTPGYMAPEQLRSDPNIGVAADIYSLGCILFEILAGEPLHSRSGPMASTVMGVDARPSQREGSSDVSPELDAVCVIATADDPTRRYTSARALAGEVQRYLDGDRDIALRRRLADRQLEAAHQALASRDEHEARRDAMRAAGRALALDPQSTEAAELVSHLVLTPPDAIPPELARELESKSGRELRAHSRVAVVGLATFFLYIPILAWIGIRDWSYIAFAYALVAASVGYAWSSTRMSRPPHHRAWITMCASAVVIALFGRLFGPFVLPAGMAAVAMAISSIHPHILRHRWIPFVVYLAAALGPWGLEVAGFLVPSYRVEHDGYLVMSNVLKITPVAGQIAIAGFIASVVTVVGIMCMRLARTSQEVRAQIELQAWHLRQLVPAARLRRPATDPA